MARDDVEGGVSDLRRYSEPSARAIESEDGLHRRLDAELPHWPGVRASEFADIGEHLVDV